MTTKLPSSGPISLLDIAQAFDLSTNVPISMNTFFSLNQRIPTAGNIALNNFAGETNLGTQNRPASNAQEIKDFTNTQLDGEYWMDISGTPTKVFCLMNDSYGGGAYIQAYNTVTAIRVSNAIVYNVNNGSSYSTIPVNRVMYYMQNNMFNRGTLYWAYTSFDAWNNSATTYRIPSVADPFSIQRNVSNLTVYSNHPNVTNGTGLAGRLEIWPYNYGPGSVLGGGSGSVYDYDDTNVEVSGYGSFQVHNMTNLSTVFAWNNHGSISDIGFGTNDINNIHYVATANNHPDWTFSSTGAYNFSLGVYIQPRNLITLPRLYTLGSVYDRYELSYSNIATITKKSGVTLSSDISTNTGMFLDASSGVISTKPKDVSQNTTYTFNVTATDASGNTETKQLKITVLYAGRTVMDNVSLKSNSMVGYSVRLINQSYTGAVVRIRRASDNTEKDFYANTFGDLGDQYLARGQSLSNWLFNTTGYVVTWYDQFGSNNATNATASTQPQIQLVSGRYVVYFNGNNNLLGFTSIYPTSFWMNVYIIQFTNSFATVFARAGADYGFRFQYTNFTGNSGDFLGSSGDTTPYWYVNNAYGKNGGGPQTVSTGSWLNIMGARASASAQPINQLGRGYTPLLRDFNGYLTDLLFFNTSTITQVHSTILNTVSLTSIPESQLVTNGLVLWIDPGKYNSYPTTGTTMYNMIDLSSNSTTIYNAPTFSTDYFTFNGTSQYMTIPSTAGVTNFTNSDAYTVCFWVWIAATQNFTTYGDNDIVEKWSGSGGYPYVFRYVSSGNIVMMGIYNGSSSVSLFLPNNTVQTNNWNFIAGVIDHPNKFMRLYHNATTYVENNNFTITGTISNASDLFIMRRGHSTLTNYVTGRFAVLQIYNRALTASEVSSNFNALRNRFGI